MSPDSEFAAFKAAAAGGDGAEPTDGNHTATLVVAKVGRSRAGDPLVICEWQTEDLAYYWTTFHSVGGRAAPLTEDLLTAFGIDTGTLNSFDELGDELSIVEGTTFTVAVKKNGSFFNVRILDRPSEVQTQIPTPAAPTEAPRNAIFDDDDVPF